VIRELTSVAELETLREPWNDLLRSSGSDGLFLTWEWLRAWWAHEGRRRKLSILTVVDDGRLVGIAPLAVAPPSPLRGLPFRAVEFLGTGSAGSDYLDLIARPGDEARVIDEVGAHLDRAGIMLRLRRMAGGRAAALRLSARLGEQGWVAREERDGVCPFIDLSAGGWDGYLGTLGAQHRATFRRKLRALERGHAVRFSRVRTEGERPAAMEALFRLHTARFSSRGGSDGLHSPSLLALHGEFSRLALERGWLRLYLLTVDGETAAVVYGFAYGGRFYFYQSGFQPSLGRESVGLVALGLSIRDAFEERLQEYDLLHGAERYKFHWARGIRSLTKLTLFPPATRGLLSRGVLDFRGAALSLTRRLGPGGGPVEGAAAPRADESA
jgi:CelD/BcsL family acetyltransferase involved in cellulose biosynthesis